MEEAERDSDESGDRTYLRIRPAAEAIGVDELTAAFTRLHSIDPSLQVEWLLVATDDGVGYYVGVDDEYADPVTHAVNALYSNTTVETADIDPTSILEALATDPAPDAGDDGESGEESNEQTEAETHAPTAGVEFFGWARRRDDWQTRLEPVTNTATGGTQFPLAGLVDTLADTPEDTTVVYQALLEPYRNWELDAMDRIQQLEWKRDTLGQRLWDFISGDFEKPDDEDLPRSHHDRIDEIEAANTATAFTVGASAYVQGPDAESIAAEIESTFAPVDGDSYSVVARTTTGSEATQVLERIRERELRTKPRLHVRLAQRLPVVPNNYPALITDDETAPNFCLVDGDDLTQTGCEAIDTTHGEQTGVTPPVDDQLATYDCTGFTLGTVLDSNDQVTDTTVSVPPDLQPLHIARFGKTGSGKSLADIVGILDNHEASEGPTIIFDSKGDGMADELLQAYYSRHGDLEDVLYFECDQFVPAIPFFDISDELAAGVPRETAIEDRIDHYLELVRGIMGDDQFAARRAPDVIRSLLKAMYDRVHGDDAFTHSEFHDTAIRMKTRQDPPPVSDPALEQRLASVADDRSDVFESVMQGVDTRIQKIPRDSRIARMFEHVPASENGTDAASAAPGDNGEGESADEVGEPAAHPMFDVADHLDANSLIVIDTGGLRSEPQHAMALVILSNLWTALRQRARREDGEASLVNIYVDEAADIADTDLVSDLLSKSRSFGLSMTLSMQYPGQLRETAPGTYREILNNVSTIVTGNVGHDRPLAERLATDDMSPGDVANRLRGLRRGQWLAKLPARFDEPEPRPFQLASPDPPAGHPASDDPLSPAGQTAFDAALYARKERTRLEHGLTVAQPSVADQDAATGPAERDAEAAPEQDAGLRPRVDTTLPYTKRLPEHLDYDGDRHALTCTGCDAVYDPDSIGLQRALECCPTDEIDPDDVPICEVTLKLTREERLDCDYSDAQLMFLQAVYNAAQLRYEPPHYDLISDSMLRLREYAGIEREAVDDLLDDGLLRHDGDQPHRLYTVTAAGRELLGERHRRGVDHGHGKGDLGESSQHVLGIVLIVRYLEQEYRDDPDSDVVEVIPYYELDADDLDLDLDDEDRGEGENEEDSTGNASRLDVAALDADGNIVVCAEVERVNNDVYEAAPADYDKMAACNPQEAIWVVMSNPAGHDVLEALNDADRVEKIYARQTPTNQFRIDEPGITAMYPATWLRGELEHTHGDRPTLNRI